jgi:sialate O-acetylesterase
MIKISLTSSLLAVALLLLLTVSFTTATITLPSYFGDNMVIQEKTKWCLPGHTNFPNAKVAITVVNTFFHQFGSATSDANGNFEACFQSNAANSNPFVISITVTDPSSGAKETLALNNLLFGHVYLCSGQSNMQMTVSNAYNASQEIATANYDMIRIFTVRQNASTEPLQHFGHYAQEGWNSATPKIVGGPDWQYTSATCYFFGRKVFLDTNQKIPIGLLVSSYGGTRVEAWSSDDALNKCKKDPPPPEPQNQPKALYNAMIVPLLTMRFKGVAWYQGENNAFDTENYKCLFPAMIQDWRDKFVIPDLPFYFVQIAAYAPGKTYPELRLSQEAALKLTNTGMASAIDLGDPQSPAGAIHPRDKQTVGFRLASIALAHLYGQNIIYSGPQFTTAVSHHDGSQFNATLTFDNQDTSMYMNGTEECTACCGSSGFDNAFEIKFQSGWTRAQKVVIVDSKTVVLYSNTEEKVTGIRYAYYPYPECALYNGAHFPSPPFVVELQ